MKRIEHIMIEHNKPSVDDSYLIPEPSGHIHIANGRGKMQGQ